MGGGSKYLWKDPKIRVVKDSPVPHSSKSDPGCFIRWPPAKGLLLLQS